MAFFNTFYDLKTATAYNTHTVGTFDTNTSSGGGTFRWVKATNTSITDIPGFRIKPSGTTTGYWERVYYGAASVGWFGTINTASQGTLASFGFSQPQLDARYGVANLVLTTDTYDTAAIKYAFYLMQERRNFQSIVFESKDYYLTSTCYLPGLFTPNSTRNINYSIDGNGAFIYDHSSVSTPMDYFGSRLPANSTEASAWQRRRFIIHNFLFNGQGAVATGSGKAAILLGESYNSRIYDNHFEYVDTAIKARFCMNTDIYHNNIVNHTGDAIVVTYGSDWGGTTANGASNHTRIIKNRIYGNINSGKGIYVIGASGIVIDDNIWEGDLSIANPLGIAGTYAVYFDNGGAGTVKECTIKSTHIERRHAAGGAFFYIRGTTGMYTIEKPYVQYDGTLIEVVTQNNGYPEIKLSGIGYIPNECKLKGDYHSRWIVEHNILPVVYGITSDATMRTGAWTTGDNSTIWYSGYKSTTSNSIGTGTKNFTIPVNATGYSTGRTITIEATSDSTKSMTGTVTSYNSSTGALVVNVTSVSGSGTFTDWTMWTNDYTPTANRIVYFGTNTQGG